MRPESVWTAMDGPTLRRGWGSRFDRNGRVAAVLPLPGNAAGTSLCFGGHDFDTLYVASGGKVYRRKLHVPGAPPWAVPVKLPPWGAG